MGDQSRPYSATEIFPWQAPCLLLPDAPREPGGHRYRKLFLKPVHVFASPELQPTNNGSIKLASLIDGPMEMAPFRLETVEPLTYWVQSHKGMLLVMPWPQLARELSIQV